MSLPPQKAKLGLRFVLLWALVAQSVSAALPYEPVSADPLLQAWRWRTYPELNGLGAQCIFEGDHGVVWFGGTEGAWSYDGIEWQRHSNREGMGGDVASICQGRNGGMIFAGHWGISEVRNGQYRRMLRFPNEQAVEIRKVTTDHNGNLWAATSIGALYFDGDMWTLFRLQAQPDLIITNYVGQSVNVEILPAFIQEKILAGKTLSTSGDGLASNFSDLCVDESGKVWLGLDSGQIIWCQNPGTTNRGWGAVTAAEGLSLGRSPTLLSRRGGELWVGYASDSAFLNVFDGQKWSSISLRDVGIAENCGGLVETRDGAVWLAGRYSVGVYRKGRWTRYEKPAVPIPLARNFIFESSDGAIWIGGPNTEIVRLDYETPRWRMYHGLNFQWESPGGAEWFLSSEGRVVLHETNRWFSLGPEDGLPDAPVALVGTRTGEIWVAGSHAHTAATARFDGRSWVRTLHGELSWGIEQRSVFESSDGSIWFAATVDSSGPREHRAGILQYRNGNWIHHHQPGRIPTGGNDQNPATLLPATQRPEPVGKFVCMGESPDRKIWAGRNLLVYFDGSKWSTLTPPEGVRWGTIQTALTTHDREFWIGSAQFGALRYDGSNWSQFQGRSNLVANAVRGLAETSDGTVWAATDRGFSRFDRQRWTADVIPAELTIGHEAGNLKATASGALWVNHFPSAWMKRAWPKSKPAEYTNFWTLRHQSAGKPPETTLVAAPKEVSSGGNFSVAWSGAEPWSDREALLEYSFRLDGGLWSAFSADRMHAFFGLAGGAHRLEVRARDHDFNVDPTPAVHEFKVHPPVWQEGWFIALLVGFCGMIIALATRLFLKQRNLRKLNRFLESEIKERVQAEAAAVASKERFRELAETIEEVFWIRDVDQNQIIYVSPAYQRIFGRSCQSVYQSPLAWLEAVHPEDRERVQQAAATQQASGKYDEEYRILRPDGEVRWIQDRAFPVGGKDGRIARIVGAARDVTTQRLAELKVAQLAAFPELNPNPVLEFDSGGKLKYANDAASALVQSLGLPSVKQLLPPETGAIVADCLANNSPRTRFETSIGSRTLSWSFYPIAKLHTVHCYLGEITERLHLEAELRQAQKMDAVGQLAGGVAHDFNNILAAMILDVELLTMDPGLTASVRQSLAELKSSIERARTLTRQLLAFGRRQVMQPRVLDLNQVVRQFVKMLERILGEDIRLELRLAAQPLMGRADAGMLEQTLMNLAVNARDAMPRGGTLMITTAERNLSPAEADQIPEAKPGHYASLIVADNGSGIAPEILPRIFEPFFTTKELGKGTGLGLSTVFGIVSQHGGVVTARSELGHGTSFEILLPACAATDPPSAPDFNATPPRGNGETVLLVEDENSVRKLTRKLLEKFGYLVLEAANGRQALEVSSQHAGVIDLLLTDIVMPEGMDGNELAHRLVTQYPRLRVILTSGYSPEMAGREISLKPGQRYLQKPVPPPDLLLAIRKLLDERRENNVVAQ